MAKPLVFKPKKGKRKPLPLPFPIDIEEFESHANNFEGTFNGNCVVITNKDSMITLYSRGYFGKGNLSRSEPIFPLKSETCVEEVLHLSLEEAYFLSYALGCLLVEHQGHFLDLDEMWTLYSNTKQNFIPRYVAYHHFRSCGWVVRSGIKFGNDFLLYKTGPDFHHASFSVKVMPIGNKGQNGNDISWIEFSGIARITESTSKELLLCYVNFPSEVDTCSPACLPHFQVNEIVGKRWVASHHEEQTQSLKKSQSVQRFY